MLIVSPPKNENSSRTVVLPYTVGWGHLAKKRCVPQNFVPLLSLLELRWDLRKILKKSLRRVYSRNSSDASRKSQKIDAQWAGVPILPNFGSVQVAYTLYPLNIMLGGDGGQKFWVRPFSRKFAQTRAKWNISFLHTTSQRWVLPTNHLWPSTTIPSLKWGSWVGHFGIWGLFMGNPGRRGCRNCSNQP